MLTGNKYLRYFAILALLVLLAAIPLIIKSNYYLSVLIIIGTYTLITVGLCLLMGYAGQVSLGHAAFFGIGAYASGILSTTFHVNPWLAMILAALITAIIAYAIGAPILKLKEHYLALASLGFGIIIYFVFVQWGDLTGGPSGLVGIPLLNIGKFEFNNDTRYYYLVWIMAVLGIVAANNLVHSRIGRALRAIHGSEVAAESMGVDTARMKVKIFMISAIYGSIAGSLYAHYVTFISPSPFGFKASVEFVLMAVVGGLTSVWGPLFGVTAVTVLTEFLRDIVPHIIPSAGGEFEIIFFGIILIIIMVFLPEGLTAGLVSLVERVRQPRKTSDSQETTDTRVDGQSLNPEGSLDDANPGIN